MARKPKLRRRAAGEGTICQRADGRWQGDISLGRENGKRQRRTVYGLAQAEVVAKIDELKEQRKKGAIVASTGQTVGEFLQRWIDAEASVITKPATLLKYRNSVRLYLIPGIGSIKLQKLRREDVEIMYGKLRERGLSAHTIQVAHVVLRKALEEAVERKNLAINPATKAKRPRIEQTEIKPFSWEQTRAILDAADVESLRAFWYLAIYTGCRCGELTGLQWDDLNLTTGKLTVRRTVSAVNGVMTEGSPKTERSRRTISIPADVVEVIRQHRADLLRLGLAGSKWVFPNPDGKVYHTAAVRTSWLRVCRAAGITGVRQHDLRHAHATLMIAAGVPIKAVSQRLGHHDAGFTLNVYGHLLENADAEAADLFAAGLKTAVAVNRTVKPAVNVG